MTAILIFVAVLIAAVLAVWLVIRSRDEPGGRSGVHPDQTGGGAGLGDESRQGPGARGGSASTDPDRRKDVERLRREDAEIPDD